MTASGRIRVFYLLIALACAGLLGYAYWLQFGPEALDPCPLCILQRVGFFIIGSVALVAALHGPGRTGRWIYGFLIAVGGGFGIAVAGRHIWLQSLPADEVPGCGPGLGYMMENFPLADTFRMVLEGSGSCAEVDWTFLGLSMPWWTLIWYVGLVAAALALALWKPRQQ